MKQIFALLSGLVFGFGLIISGMSDPAKVLNFLDLFGTWDPGPALTALPIGASGTLIFVPFMLVGMWLARNTPDFGRSKQQGAPS